MIRPKIWNFDLDIKRKTYMTNITPKQGDIQSNVFRINLFQGAEVYDLTGLSVKAYFKRPDEAVSFIDGVVTGASEGKVEITLTNQILNLVGDVQFELLILGTDGEALSTVSFSFKVLSSLDYTETESTNEFNALVTALSEVQNIDNRFNSVNAQLAQRVKNITVDLLSPQYGIKGDGTDEHAKIQAVFDMVESWGGGKITVPSSPSGTYGLSDTIWIGSNITLEFIGNSYFKLLKYTSTGTIIINRPGATNIVINNPLLDGGGTDIIVGGSGQNGIGVVRVGRMVVNGGHIRNCARGSVDPADGGKGIQVESHYATSFLADGTFIENCHKAISTLRSFIVGSEDGEISVRYENIHGKNCDQFAMVHQTNSVDNSGLKHNVSITNFLSENCGSIDGILILSRAYNVNMSGRIIGSTPVDSIIRGRHSQCKFDIDILVDCSSVIDLNPSYYGLDEGLSQENVYEFNVFSTYDYLLKSDITGVKPNRELKKSEINAYLRYDANNELMSSNSVDLTTHINLRAPNGKQYSGTTGDLRNYEGNKMSTVGMWRDATLTAGWSNYDAVNYTTAQYRKTNNVVNLRGAISGSGTNIFTLPVGFRPSKKLTIPLTYFDGTSVLSTFINIFADGRVLLFVTSITPALLSLDNISFKAEQ